MHSGWGRSERDRDTESEAGSRLWAVSTKPDVGLEPTDHEIMTWAEVRRSTNWAIQCPSTCTLNAGILPKALSLALCCSLEFTQIYSFNCHWNVRNSEFLTYISLKLKKKKSSFLWRPHMYIGKQIQGAPRWRSRLSVRLRPGHKLAVREFEPRVGLWADGSEPGACFRFCVSLSLCPSPVHALSLSVPKIN